MPSISWDDRLALGIPEIDEQHQRLVQMIDDLSEAMIQGRSQEVLDSLLAGLYDYARIHFATEERYLAEVCCPQVSQHRAEHQEFISRVTRLTARFQQGAVGVSIDVLDFLGTWLVRHIQQTDGDFGRFYAAARAGASA